LACGKARSDPGLCPQFVDAALESWMYAFDHPEETLTSSSGSPGRKIDRKPFAQQWMLDRVPGIYIPKRAEENHNRTFIPGDYKMVSDIMQNSKLDQPHYSLRQFLHPLQFSDEGKL